MMTELERRALMGDPAAQQECTEKGIVLSCPKCFKPVKVNGPEDWKPTFYDPDSGGDPYGFYCECGLAFETDHYEFKEALAEWNTRTAPPIGLCLDCKKQSFNENTGNTWCTLKKPRRKVSPLGFCSEFEPKEREENGSTID